MRCWYVFAILCVCVIKHARARRNIISYGVAKLNQRRVGAVDVITEPNVDLEKCLEHCDKRHNCKGINFSKRYRFCEVLAYKNDTLDEYEQTLSYISIDRKELEEFEGKEPTTRGNCSSCTSGACDTTTDTCEVTECGPVRIANGIVYGNMHTPGSRVKVTCTGNHLLAGGVGTLICQSDGLWSSSPSCAWDCGEPWPSKGNEIISPGNTYNGTTRTYTCKGDYFLTGRRNETEQNTTCIYGGYWDNHARCVKDCSEPLNASDIYALERIHDPPGPLYQDYDMVTYICPPNHVVFGGKPATSYGIRMPNRLNIHYDVAHIYCDGYFPMWKHQRYRCVKNCTDGPRPENIRAAQYGYQGNNISLSFWCEYNYVVFDGSTLLPIRYYISWCNVEPNGTWTNNTWTCQKDCRLRPDTTNANVTFTAENNNVTIVTYICDDGYTVYDDSSRMEIDRFETECTEANGTWAHDTWSCQKDCRNRPVETNVQNVTYTFENNATTGRFACKDGYTVYDDSTRLGIEMFDTECSEANGTWSNSTLSCQKDCTNGPDRANIKNVDYFLLDDDVTATFTCADGYAVYDGSTMTDFLTFDAECKEANGTWSNGSSSCQKDCFDGLNTTNAQTVKYTLTGDNVTATVTCEEGKSVFDGSTNLNIDTFTALCDTPEGSWTNDTLSCQPVTGFTSAGGASPGAGAGAGATTQASTEGGSSSGGAAGGGSSSK